MTGSRAITSMALAAALGLGVAPAAMAKAKKPSCKSPQALSWVGWSGQVASARLVSGRQVKKPKRSRLMCWPARRYKGTVTYVTEAVTDSRQDYGEGYYRYDHVEDRSRFVFTVSFHLRRRKGRDAIYARDPSWVDWSVDWLSQYRMNVMSPPESRDCIWHGSGRRPLGDGGLTVDSPEREFNLDGQAGKSDEEAGIVFEPTCTGSSSFGLEKPSHSLIFSESARAKPADYYGKVEVSSKKTTVEGPRTSTFTRTWSLKAAK